MADFYSFCETVDSCAEQAIAVTTASSRVTLWPAFDAAVRKIVERSARFEARAKETDPDKRVYGPAMAAKVLTQVGRVKDIARLHASLADAASREVALLESRAAESSTQCHAEVVRLREHLLLDSTASAATTREGPSTPAVNWHCWRHPEVPIRTVLAIGVYALPADATEHEGWQVLCSTLMNSCREFHMREFPGSRLSTAVCGPLVLPCESTSFQDDAEGFYGLCLDQVTALAKSGPFPETVVSHSSEGTGPELAAVDIIVFTVFADWGQEAAAPNLHKYYLVKPAAKKGVDLGDITQERVGGSRSAFYGRVSVSSFAALHDIIRECRLAFQPSSSALDEPSGGTVAYGLGLVTQEAWRHPEVNGSDSVSYHEGLGHALAMPHPQERQAMCVMDHGQYQDLPLMQLHICPEIKAEMISPSLSPIISTLVGQQAPLLDTHHSGSEDLAGSRELTCTTSLPLLLIPAHTSQTPAQFRINVATHFMASRHASSNRLLGWNLNHRTTCDVVELGWTVMSSSDTHIIVFRSQPVMLQRNPAATSCATVSAPLGSSTELSRVTLRETGIDSSATFLPLNSDIKHAATAIGMLPTLPPPLFVPEYRPFKPSAATMETTRPHLVHGRLPGEPFALGVEWIEQQLACIPSSVRGVVALSDAARHTFREVRWLQQPQSLSHTDGGGASSAEARREDCPYLLLLDAGRNIAIALPVDEACGRNALICCSGLHGRFSSFHEGQWCTRGV